MSLGINTDNVCPVCKTIEYMAGRRRGCSTCRGVDPNGNPTPPRIKPTTTTPAPIAPKKEEPMNRWTAEEVSTLKAMAEEGKTCRQAAEALGRPYAATQKYASNHSIRFKQRGRKPVATEATPTDPIDTVLAPMVEEKAGPKRDYLSCAHECNAESEAPCDDCKQYDLWTAKAEEKGAPLCEHCDTTENVRQLTTGEYLCTTCEPPVSAHERTCCNCAHDDTAAEDEPCHSCRRSHFPESPLPDRWEPVVESEAEAKSPYAPTRDGREVIIGIDPGNAPDVMTFTRTMVMRSDDRKLKLELIDTRLRLVAALCEGGHLPASFRCAVEDEIERIRELVREVAS